MSNRHRLLLRRALAGLPLLAVLSACSILVDSSPLPTLQPTVGVQTVTALALATPTAPPPTAGAPATPTPVPAAGAINGWVWHDVCEPGKDGQPQPAVPPPGCVAAADGSYQANAIYDAGEPYLENVKVRLGLGACPAFGLGEVHTGPGEAGYAFTGLAAGTYCVTVDPMLEPNFSLLVPGTWTYPALNIGSQTVTLGADEGRSGVSFGWDYQFLPNLPCTYRAAFITDVTIPDNTVLAEGTAFTKTWRLRNDGNCAWGPGYPANALVFTGGANLAAVDRVALPQVVAAGATVDVSVPMVAPATTGTGLLRSEWKLALDNAAPFGVGAKGDEPIFALVVVPPRTATPTPSRTPTPLAISGWRADYFANRTLSGTPAFVRDDGANLDFNWGAAAPATGLPADNFSIRWTRTLTFTSGTYRFRILADDGVALWVDNQLLIDDWKDGGSGEVAADLALAAGAHAVRVEYYEASGNASFKLWWEAVSAPAFPEWKGEYWANRQLSGTPALTRNDRSIDFDWGNTAPAVGLPADEFSVRWTRTVPLDAGRYRFSATADDGVRVYVGGVLVIDEWHESDATRTYQADVTVTGATLVVVEYYDLGLRATVKVRWEKLP